MSKSNSESGFSYIDVMIGLTILLVGVLAITSALTANLIRSRISEQQMVAKQAATSAVNSMFAVRDRSVTASIGQNKGAIKGWDSLANVNPNDVNAPGIFLAGWRPVREDPGSDGVVGTADDACDAAAACKVGTNPANNSAVLRGLERQILIENVEDPDRPSAEYGFTRRKVTVTVRYFAGQAVFQEKTTTIFTNFKNEEE